ncbi:glycosyltransferase family 2 protein [Nitratireductor sp. ac15]
MSKILIASESTAGSRIRVAVVSMDPALPEERLLARQQGLLAGDVVRVVAAEAQEDAAFALHSIPSRLNMGGAGGFSYAILSALAGGAEWVWIMDDDAFPVGEDCLKTLLEEAKARGLEVVSPIIVAPEDQQRLSFPFRVRGKLTHDRAAVETLDFIPSMAQFFNGALVHRDVFFKVGLPDMRLFIRGDEVDFMVRLRRAGIRFGTVTNAVVAHPPGWGEIVPIISGRVHVLIPETEFKRYYFFRNRGYLARRHRRLKSFVGDLVLYPFVYIVKRRFDWAGLAFWWRAFRDGLAYRFDRAPHLNP